MAGIYIHIPFCKQACTYCDFHFSTTFEAYRQEFTDALCTEIEIRKDYFSEEDTISTLYFGGGTPSILNKRELSKIMDTLNRSFDLGRLNEFTLEANPDDISGEKIIEWKSVGINRLSIGLQSFRDEDLGWMNRAHRVREGETAIQLAQKHFSNLSVDLMYGLPNLDIVTWKNHILRLVNMGVQHISAYCLTVEKKTTLHHWVKQQKVNVPDDGVQAQQMECLMETLKEKGYEHYEISNFCLPNFHSQHNSNYWKNEKYVGLGPSAHGYNLVERYHNIPNNAQYIKRIKSGGLFYEVENLSIENRFNEFLLIGLRTVWGVDFKKLNSILPLNKTFWSEIDEFIASGEIEKSETHIQLTPKGFLKADYIAAQLFV